MAVPLDPRLAPSEVARMVDHARVVALVADGERVGSALAGPGGDAGDMPSLAVVVDASTEGSAPAGATVGDQRRCLSWDHALDADASPYQVPLDPDDLADIMFTSGTTGRPKGVAVRHVNASTVPNGAPVWGGGLWLHASPLTTFAGLAFVYAPMKLGMTCVYQPRFDADEWLDFVESERPEAVFLVPAMVQLLLGHPRLRADGLLLGHPLLGGQRPARPVGHRPAAGADARRRGLQQLRDDRGRVGLLRDAQGRGGAASGLGGQAPAAGQGQDRRRRRRRGAARRVRRDRAADPRVDRASTSRTPRPPPRPGSTAGCTRATSARSIARATSTSAGGPRTSSSAAGRTSTPSTSRTSSSAPGRGRGGGDRGAP